MSYMSSNKCGRNSASVMMADGGWLSNKGERSEIDVKVKEGIEWDARAKSESTNSTTGRQQCS